MKYTLTAIFLSACLLQPAVAADEAAPAAFEKLQSLVGDWRGELPDGNWIVITYERINGGAIVERYRSSDPMWWNMSSAYHLDNDRIIMTHYCSWGNHPRMTTQANQASVHKLAFNFLDMAENKPENGYMREVTFEFEDEDHFKHHWTWREDGEETPLTLVLERVY